MNLDFHDPNVLAKTCAGLRELSIQFETCIEEILGAPSSQITSVLYKCYHEALTFRKFDGNRWELIYEYKYVANSNYFEKLTRNFFSTALKKDPSIGDIYMILEILKEEKACVDSAIDIIEFSLE